MDLMTAFLNCKNRKRKAPSPPAIKIEEKSPRLSIDKDDSDDVQIVEEACGKTIILDKTALDSSLNDCKENKAINTNNIVDKNPESNDKKELNDRILCDVNKDTLSVPLPSPKSIKNDSDQDMDVSELEKSKISDVDSCNDLPSSAIESSFNKSLNTSVTGDDVDEKDVTDSKKTDTSVNKGQESDTKKEVKEKVKKKKMTPAEAQKRAEEREEKKRLLLLKKQELENKKKERQLEKERKAKEKQIKKEREELERQERERLKQEKKEQEEKEKQLKLQQKIEENRKKEEVRLKKEEEKKKVDEEKLKKLGKEQKEREKAEKAKAAFAKFFVRGNNSSSTPAAQAPEKKVFLPFQVSDDMILAPVVPAAAQERFNKKQLDHYLECQDGKELYLQILKSGSYKDVRHRKRNKEISTPEPDVIIIDKNAQAELSLTRKLLMFTENIRPPYWGTWRKKSKTISGRRPFAQDTIFDYDVDSEEEWEEGQGESLSGTEPEDEDEPEDEYEVDNEFFVPHGYLSDEEEKMEEDDDDEADDPDKHKARLKMKLQEFERERKKKTTELKPIILGCFFINEDKFKDTGLQKFLQDFSVEVLAENQIPTRFTVKDLQSSGGNNERESPNSAEASAAKKRKMLEKKYLPEEAYPKLIRLIHGNMRNKKALAEEFIKLWGDQCPSSSEVKTEEVLQTMDVDEIKDVAGSSIKNSQILRTIREIATYGKPPDTLINRPCWWVQETVREKYGIIDVDFPNDKDYVSIKVITVKEEKVVVSKGSTIKEFLAQPTN